MCTEIHMLSMQTLNPITMNMQKQEEMDLRLEKLYNIKNEKWYNINIMDLAIHTDFSRF